MGKAVRKRRHIGHPARQTRAQKRQAWFRPDRDEQHIREIARMWREKRQALPREDGDISGLLAVAGELAAVEIAKRYPELSDAEHAAAVAQWFYGVWGETIHRFDPARAPLASLLGVPAYEMWRGVG